MIKLGRSLPDRKNEQTLVKSAVPPRESALIAALCIRSVMSPIRGAELGRYLLKLFNG